MKRLFLALACVLFWASAAVAQTDAPNIRQSINYFMNYFNESVIQAIHVKEHLQQEKLEKKRPYTEEYVFFVDLNGRIEKTLGLALNLSDLYYLYNRTTYCFTKDEKAYLFDRIDNIRDALQKIVETPYNVEQKSLEDEKSLMRANLVEFNERVEKLRAFIKSSLGVFDR